MKNQRKLQIKAKDLWKCACILRWGKRCLCGARAISVHHFIKKSRCNNLRYDVQNGVPICKSCHWIIEFSPDTLKRREVENKIITSRGKEWFTYIQEQSKVILRSTGVRWLREQIQKLEKIRKELL